MRLLAATLLSACGPSEKQKAQFAEGRGGEGTVEAGNGALAGAVGQTSANDEQFAEAA